MNPADLPKISPLLLATLIEAAPGRVRGRLEKSPDAARSWTWRQDGQTWLVEAGEEAVQIVASGDIIQVVDQIKCSCLLTPKCFHILACISILHVDQTSNPEIKSNVDHANESDDAEPLKGKKFESQLGVAGQDVSISADMRAAALLAQSAVESMISVGARNAGLLIQSGLLRAGHQCRSASLFSLANATLRVAEGVQRLRSQDSTTDAFQLQQDIAASLKSSHIITTRDSAPLSIIGQARRTFEPTDIRKLHGFLAEPIITLSGYCGVAVYFQANASELSSLYTINELRPGDAQLITQAYRGGIDVGTISIDGFNLCRHTYTVQNLTQSIDGRLGKGKSVLWAQQASKPRVVAWNEGRFGLPIRKQIELIFSLAQYDDPPFGGWDLIAFQATILGPKGSSLLAKVEGFSRPVELRIAVDDPAVTYRENLSMLARASGLSIRCLGRLRLDQSGRIDLLAIANSAYTDQAEISPTKPRLMLPESWLGICNFGLDRLQRQHILGIERWSDDIQLSQDENSVNKLDAAESISRRLISLTLGGRKAVPDLASVTHRRDHQRLTNAYQPTAAELLELVSQVAHQSSRYEYQSNISVSTCNLPSLGSLFLACATYVAESTRQTQRELWLDAVPE